MKNKLRHKNYGFSLVEVLIATLFIGLAITSLLAVNTSLTKVNAAAADLSTAEFLLEQIKERTTLAAYNSLYAFDDATYCPPIDADGQTLSDFSAFTQQVAVENVSNTDFTQIVADDTSDFAKITVTVSLNNRQISQASWIRADY